VRRGGARIVSLIAQNYGLPKGVAAAGEAASALALKTVRICMNPRSGHRISGGGTSRRQRRWADHTASARAGPGS